MCERWETEGPDEARAFTFGQTIENRDWGQGVDTTGVHLEIALRLVEQAKTLHGAVERLRRHTEGIELAIAGIQSLNPRQRSLLARLALDPTSFATAEGHRESCGCAYSTARSDLVSLEERGLLQLRTEHGTNVYTLGPKAKSLLKTDISRKRA